MSAHNSRVVKAFGHTWAKVLARDPSDDPGGKRVLFVSGNNAEANDASSSLIERFGFQPIVLGSNAEGGLLQQFAGPLTMRSFISQQVVGNAPPEKDIAP